MSHHLTNGPAIPDDNAPVSPAHRPTWWTVRTVRSIAFVCVGLAVALSLLSTLVSWRSAEAANARAVEVERRLTLLEEYVQGRGDYRDAEAERLEREAKERIRAGLCDLLDQLPPSPLLDVPRQKYGCGPGAPPVDPPAAEPSSATAGTPPATPPTAAATSAEASGSARLSPVQTGSDDRPAPAPTPARPPTSPAAPRVLDLDPLTDPVCRLLGACP